MLRGYRRRVGEGWQSCVRRRFGRGVTKRKKIGLGRKKGRARWIVFVVIRINYVNAFRQGQHTLYLDGLLTIDQKRPFHLNPPPHNFLVHSPVYRSTTPSIYPPRHHPQVHRYCSLRSSYSWDIPSPTILR